MELRILSGLHRGAVMEIDDTGEFTIGSSPGGDLDVLLADTGVAQRHCRLTLKAGRLQLEPLQGKVFDAQGQALAAAVTVERGRTFRLADVWIGFFHTADPWKDTAIHVTKSTGYPRMKAPVMTAALAAVVLPTAWFASTAWGNVQLLGGARLPAPVALTAPLVPDAPPSPAKLADEFTRALAERELRDRLDLQLQPNQWEIRGSLDGDERQRFERLLVRFIETHKPTFPIKVSLVTPAELLPFKVVEVITGKGASVVTESGDRLQVGEAIQGWKLVSIDAAKVVFLGKQRVEVAL
jgi:type III secretion protein D